MACVAWNDVLKYIQWLNNKTGKNYRLPTEAEWEYAARAGTTTRYWWGNEIGNNNANCDGCGSQWDSSKTALVGSFDSNPWSLYDTAGNVWEWTCSLYVSPYNGSENQCVSNNHANGSLVVRGGSWDDNPSVLRAACRGSNAASDRHYGLGVRLVQD